MNLIEIKKKLTKEAQAKKARLIEESNALDYTLIGLNEDLEIAVGRLYERKENWEKEVADTWGADEEYDAWDRGIYGDYYDEMVYNLEEPVHQIEADIREVHNLKDEITDKLFIIEAVLKSALQKAETEFKETAVFRWLT